MFDELDHLLDIFDHLEKRSQALDNPDLDHGQLLLHHDNSLANLCLSHH